MMCHRIGRFPISIMGFGLTVLSSLILVPNPPANMTACMFECDDFDFSRLNASIMDDGMIFSSCR
jgi:hypothetical protein